MLIPKNYLGKTIGINEGPRRDKMFKITAQGAVEVDRKSVTGDILTVRPEELDYFQGIQGGKLSSSLNAAGYVSHEERLGTEAARAQYGDKFRDRPGLEPGVYTPEPYQAPVETYAMKFKKEQGRLPTPAEMEAAGQGTTQYPKEQITPTPTDFSKFYKPGLSEPQKQSIENLIKTGRVFNETDAKNYAYATGDSDYKKYIGKTGSQISGGAGAPGGAAGTPGATGTPGTTPVTENTVAEDAYQKALNMYTKGYDAPNFDKVAKRKELTTQSGLDARKTKVDEMDRQIDSLETVMRNREEELRGVLSSRNATEADIKRELAGQLRPLQRQLTDLYTARNIEGNIYNREMARIETDLGDLETAHKDAILEAEKDFERRVKGYGLQIDRSASLAKEKTTRAKELFDISQKIPKGQTYTMSDGTKVVGTKESTKKTTPSPITTPITTPKVQSFDEFIAEKRKIMSIQDPEKFRAEYEKGLKNTPLAKDIISQMNGQVIKDKVMAVRFLDDVIKTQPNATWEELFLAGSVGTSLTDAELKALLQARGKNPTKKSNTGSSSTDGISEEDEKWFNETFKDVE